jgi:hypothetical protein
MKPAAKREEIPVAPTASQRAWLERGLDEPGGKLPLFDLAGQRISPRTVKSCIEHGWAEPWFTNPMKPEWLVCKLTQTGRAVLNRLSHAAPPRPAKAKGARILVLH